MPEGEKIGGQVVIGGDNMPSPVGKGLTDLPNIGGGAVPPFHPGPPVPASLSLMCMFHNA